MAPALACIIAILSWARCSSAPESPKVFEIPAAVSPTDVSACAAVYWAFSTSFWVRNWFTRCCRAEGLLQLVLLLGELLVLRLHRVDLGLSGGLAVQRLPGQVFLALSQRRLRLVLQVVDGVLKLLLLQLDPLADAAMSTSARRTSVRWSSICS